MAKNKHRQADLEPIGHTNTYVHFYACVHTQRQIHTRTLWIHTCPLAGSHSENVQLVHLFFQMLTVCFSNAFVFATGMFTHTYTHSIKCSGSNVHRNVAGALADAHMHTRGVSLPSACLRKIG